MPGFAGQKNSQALDSHQSSSFGWLVQNRLAGRFENTAASF